MTRTFSSNARIESAATADLALTMKRGRYPESSHRTLATIPTVSTVDVEATQTDRGVRSASAQAGSLLIVIVNYRTPQLVVDGLTALAPEVGVLKNARVVVVDGGSGDDSAEIISRAIEAEGWRDWCKLVALTENRGFAAGNNAVIGAALADDDAPAYVLLLNPDTRIHRGAIERLRAYLEDQPHVGIAGSRLEDPDGTPQVSAFRFPSVASEFLEGLQWNVASRLLPERDVAIEPPPATAGPVDWVAGASMMIRRQVFEAVGLLDEGYFLYFEEVDFCLKARRAQWATHYVPDSRVIHYIGQSTGVSDERRARPRLPRYWFESRERFFMNNHGHIRRRLADAAFACGFAAFRLRQRIQRKPDREPPRRWRDFVKYNFIPEWEAPRRPSGPSRGGRPAVQDRGRYNENPPDIGLIDLLVEDFKTYDRNVWEQGLWAIAVHRLGNARMSVRFLPVRAALSLSYKAAFKGVEIATGITLPYTVQVGRRVRIWHHGCMILHAESIGDDVTIRQNTTMGVRRTYENEDLPIIGHRVDLAAGVSILGAVRVGDGATVAAHAVVIDDVAPGSTVGGVPAAPLHRRDAEGRR